MERFTYSTALVGLANHAGPIYCDTSFLLDLFARHLQNIGHSPDLSRKQERITAASQFFFDAQADKRAFVTSIFGVEESFQALCFHFVREEVVAAGLRSWKELRDQDLKRFSHALDAGRRLVHEFDVFLKEKEVDILALGQQPRGQPPILEAHIGADARMISAAVAVDVMDVFHYVTMLRFGIAIAASSDRDWLLFPTGKLITW